MYCVLCQLHGISQTGLPKPDYPCQLSNGEPCNACQKLEHLESKIAETTEALISLVNQHRQVRTEVNHPHNAIISRIPPEVTSSIFEFSLSADEERRHRTVWQPYVKNSAPLALGAVCRTWRQIAWATPRLWACLSISLELKKLPWLLEAVQAWLARSGRLPLSIHVYIPNFQTELTVEDSSTISLLIGIINQLSGRWQHLSLAVPRSLISQFSGGLHGVSILKTLVIRALDFERPASGNFGLTHARPSPSEVNLDCIRFDCVDISWNNVTRVSFDYLHADECLELLRIAPLLFHCKLDNVVAPVYYFPIPRSPIVHNNLKELEFTGFDDEPIVFFDKLSLPALTTLKYSNEGQDVLPANPFTEFVKRSSCRLKALHLSTGMLRDEDLFALLCINSSLSELDISAGSWEDDDYSPYNLFELMGKTSVISRDAQVPHDDETKVFFLPELRSFSFTPDPAEVDWKRVPEIFGPSDIDLQNSRRRPLEALKIPIYREKKDDPYAYIDYPTLLCFKRLQDEGIDLKFTDERDHKDLIELSLAHHAVASGAEEDTQLQSAVSNCVVL